MGELLEVVELDRFTDRYHFGMNEDSGKIMIGIGIIKQMLGGEWPEDENGFCFDAVDHYRCEDGRLVPYDGADEPCPGPDFEVKIIPIEWT